jgi:mono/diheme cytochrome c family protein
MKTRIALGLSALLLLAGCKASAPGSMETKIVNEVKQHVTIGGKDWKNPIKATPESQREGQEHFGHHCQICHGLDGQNTGVPFAEKMDPPVPPLNSSDVQDYSDGQLKWIIENGISPSGMPGWKGILTDEEMWNIVNYLRHLPPKGSLGVPPVYQEAEHEHEHEQQHEHQHQHGSPQPEHQHQ